MSEQATAFRKQKETLDKITHDLERELEKQEVLEKALEESHRQVESLEGLVAQKEEYIDKYSAINMDQKIKMTELNGL